MSDQTGRRDFPTLFTQLPGPDRKRATCPYSYQLTYRNPQTQASGCRMIWQVSGGRLVYQIVLEQNDRGALQFHCSCADAVFRAESEGRFCKHVRGLLHIGQASDEAVDQLQPRARLGA
jgi:predicted nucleic acid-binding Zn finger protein